MDFIEDLLIMALEHGIVYIIWLYVLVSIGLFIYDGIKAGKEKRKRKIWITIMFIIADILIILSVISIIFLVCTIGWYIFNS